MNSIEAKLTELLILAIVLCTSTCNDLLRLKSSFSASLVSTEKVQSLIEEMMTGPLAHSDVSILFDPNSGQAGEIDLLLKCLDKPITLISVNEGTSNEQYGSIKDGNLVNYK